MEPLTAGRRQRFADWAFGAPLAPPRPALVRLAVGAAMVLAGILVVLFRLPVEQQNVLWSEDGNQFLQAAFQNDFVTNLFTPYAGYMHFLPRTAGQLVAAFVPTTQLGLGMNIAGATVWSVVAIAAFVFSRGRLQTPLRWLLWLLVLIVPIGSMEVATNVANSHWFLIFGLAMAVFARSGPGLGRLVFGAVLVATAVMSDPLALAFAPVLIARAIALPRVRENILGLVFAASAVVQVLMVLSTERDRGGPQLQPGSQTATYLVRVVWGDLLGQAAGTRLYDDLGRTTAIVLAGAFVLALTAFIVLHRRRAGYAAVTLGASFGFWSVTAVLTWVSIGRQPEGLEVFLGGRYLVVPSLLLVVAILAAVSAGLPGADARGVRRIVRIAVLVVVAAALVTPGILNYQVPSAKAGVPELTVSVPGFRDACAANPSALVDVPIAPPGFTFAVPCERILSNAP